MTANECKSYLSYSTKLTDEYKITYQCSMGSKSFHGNYSAFYKEFEQSHKAFEFKVDDRVRITKCKNIFSKVYTEKSS